MTYERELRGSEIRSSMDLAQRRKDWPAIGTLPKKYNLPETCEADLAVYWDQLIDSGLSWQSVKANYNAARHCTKILLDAGMSYETVLVDREEIVYLRDVAFAKLAPDTVKWYICLYGKYLAIFGNDVVSDMHLIWRNSTVRCGVDWLTEDQAQALMGTEGLTIPERTALILMLGMGLRRIEVLRLTVDDIMPDGLMVCGKGRGGGKYRFIPYCNGGRDQIRKMMRWREGQIAEAHERHGDFDEDRHLFLTNDKSQPPHYYNQAGTGFDKSVLAGIRRKSGIEFTGNHTLRRTFARLVYLKNPDERNLQILARYLGHEDTKTTLDYIGISGDELRTVAESCSWF